MNELWIGITGMALILFAFFMNQIGKWKHDYIIYDAFNFIGGSMMIFYSYRIKSYPFLVLNVVWTLVSFVDGVIGYRKAEKRKTHIQHKRK